MSLSASLCVRACAESKGEEHKIHAGTTRLSPSLAVAELARPPQRHDSVEEEEEEEEEEEGLIFPSSLCMYEGRVYMWNSGNSPPTFAIANRGLKNECLLVLQHSLAFFSNFLEIIRRVEARSWLLYRAMNVEPNSMFAVV